MSNKLFTFICVLLLSAIAPSVFAAESKITMITQAPAGTALRIYSMPYNDATVTGADESKYFGEYLSKGPGTEITVTGNIEQLEVYGCQLSDLTVVDAPDLYILRCHNNNLKELAVGNCPNLSVLDCHNNQLTGIVLEKNNLLEELNASGNAIEFLELGLQPLMTKLNLSSNKLKTADLSRLPVLWELHIENNDIDYLDLSANTALMWIYVYGNKIAGEGMSEFVKTLPAAVQVPSLLYIVDTFSETEGNVCLMKDVKAASEKGWVTMDYANGTLNSGMIGQFYYGADYVPSISDNGVRITTSRKAGEKVKLYIKAQGDFAVEGVAESNFVSGNNTLTLSSSEIFVKGDLTEFECTGNDITALAFEGAVTALRSFDCSNNKIESLAVNNAPQLTQIHAQKNALKSLDISGCTGIMRVDCYDNNLRGKAMKAFMESLPDGTANEPYLFVIDTKSDTEKNVATTDDVAIAKAKNWVVFDYIGGDKWGMGAKYDGSEPTGPELPEEFFTFTTVEASEVLVNIEFYDSEYYPVVEDAEILGWGSGALTLRVTPGKPVKVYGDAKAISSNIAYIDSFDADACPNLVELSLMANELTTLDVSKNTKLQQLLIFGNSLESLDVSGCADLKFIICYGNRLAGDAMTQLMSTLPMRSSAEPGQIIIYDSSYEREYNVCTGSDVQAARGRYWLAYELVDGKPVLYEGTSGVGNVEVENGSAPVEYYNLQGVRVDNPTPGIYIRRQGKTAAKIRL